MRCACLGFKRCRTACRAATPTRMRCCCSDVNAGIIIGLCSAVLAYLLNYHE